MSDEVAQETGSNASHSAPPTPKPSPNPLKRKEPPSDDADPEPKPNPNSNSNASANSNANGNVNETKAKPLSSSRPLAGSSETAGEVPEEYKNGHIVCPACGLNVNIRDDESGVFTTKMWEAHRAACCPPPSTSSRGCSSGEASVIYTPEATVESMQHPPTKRRRAKRTEEERIDYLRADPYVAQFEAYRVLCASCDKWIRLRPNSTYCSIPWDAHRKSCLAKKINNKNAYALEERNNLFSKDTDIRKFDAERILCNRCDQWLSVSPDDHLLAVQKWLHHRASCSKTPSGHSTRSLAKEIPRAPPPSGTQLAALNSSVHGSSASSSSHAGQRGELRELRGSPRHANSNGNAHGGGASGASASHHHHNHPPHHSLHHLSAQQQFQLSHGHQLRQHHSQGSGQGQSQGLHGGSSGNGGGGGGGSGGGKYTASSPPFHDLTPNNYAPLHESRRRNAEQRADTLRRDPLIGAVEPNRVFCTLCQKWVQLRQDSSFCAYPWLQHRSKCVARHQRRAQKIVDLSDRRDRVYGLNDHKSSSNLIDSHPHSHSHSHSHQHSHSHSHSHGHRGGSRATAIPIRDEDELLSDSDSIPRSHMGNMHNNNSEDEDDEERDGEGEKERERDGGDRERDGEGDGERDGEGEEDGEGSVVEVEGPDPAREAQGMGQGQGQGQERERPQRLRRLANNSNVQSSSGSSSRRQVGEYSYRNGGSSAHHGRPGTSSRGGVSSYGSFDGRSRGRDMAFRGYANSATTSASNGNANGAGSHRHHPHPHSHPHSHSHSHSHSHHHALNLHDHRNGGSERYTLTSSGQPAMKRVRNWATSAASGVDEPGSLRGGGGNGMVDVDVDGMDVDDDQRSDRPTRRGTRTGCDFERRERERDNTRNRGVDHDRSELDGEGDRDRDRDADGDGDGMGDVDADADGESYCEDDLPVGMGGVGGGRPGSSGGPGSSIFMGQGSGLGSMHVGGSGSMHLGNGGGMYVGHGGGGGGGMGGYQGHRRGVVHPPLSVGGVSVVRRPYPVGLADLDSPSGRKSFLAHSIEYLYATTYESTDDLTISALLTYVNAAMPVDKHEDYDTAEVVKYVAALKEKGRVVFLGDVVRLVE
ncbi:hypothetical protein CC2G_012318 [Coprinopsis cinerea AmutBmut pab1-1]|nr:hypothetical protein CC2G_012318 [Coprinopsis cinerea AmutBmut pab1-1]